MSLGCDPMIHSSPTLSMHLIALDLLKLPQKLSFALRFYCILGGWYTFEFLTRANLVWISVIDW